MVNHAFLYTCVCVQYIIETPKNGVLMQTIVWGIPPESLQPTGHPFQHFHTYVLWGTIEVRAETSPLPTQIPAFEWQRLPEDAVTDTNNDHITTLSYQTLITFSLVWNYCLCHCYSWLKRRRTFTTICLLPITIKRSFSMPTSQLSWCKWNFILSYLIVNLIVIFIFVRTKICFLL